MSSSLLFVFFVTTLEKVVIKQNDSRKEEDKTLGKSPITKVYKKKTPRDFAISWGFQFVWMANKPSTSDNSTLCASTAYVKNNLVHYLPLSGGAMTGAIKNTGETSAVSSDTDGKSIVIAGASSAENGAYLHLYGKDNTGCFYLNAIDNENNSTLKGMPNGALTWRGSQIERIVKSSSNYVRYENIQICWGTVTIPANLRRYEVTLPVAFVNTSYSMNCTSQTDGVAISSWGRTTTGFTINALGSSDGAYNYEKIVSFMCVGWWK